jgi:hypothetical protein
MLVSDTTNGNRLLIGTGDQLPNFLRFRPQAGEGVAITNDGDKIGLFVRASDGNVGVGTADPRSELDVKGSISADFISASIVFVNFEGQDVSVAQLLANLLGRVQSLEFKVQLYRRTRSGQRVDGNHAAGVSANA